jgi:hypothetical protein
MAGRILPGLIATTLGAIFSAIGGCWMYNATRFNAVAEKAEGVVIRLDTRESHDRGRVSRTFVPVVEFEAAGRKITFTGSVGSAPAAYKVGERVKVVFAPGNPDDARIDSFWEQYVMPGIFLGVGVICLLIGLVLLFGRAAWFARPPGPMVTVKARVTAIRQEHVQADGRSFWLLLAEYHDERLGKSHVFTSAPLSADPAAKHPVGSEVIVAYNPAQPAMYRLRL